jgi:hypothetical protein
MELVNPTDNLAVQGVDVNVIFHAALYVLYGEPQMKYTGWCENGVNTRGFPEAADCVDLLTKEGASATPSEQSKWQALRPLQARAAVGAEVVFVHPCMFSIENCYGNIQGGA